MKKRNLLVLLLGGMVMLSTDIMGRTDGNDNDLFPDVTRSPAYSPYAYITYDESNGAALVTFNSAIDEAEVIVYQNGIEIDYQLLKVGVGTQIPIFLSSYGNGEFSIQVKSGTTLLALYSINL